MTAKEYLNQAKHLKALINSRLREIEYWRDLSAGVSGCGFEPNYNPNTPTEASFVKCLMKIEEIQADIKEKAMELTKLQGDIDYRIGLLTDYEEQLVLRYRYIENLSWVDISTMLNVSERTVYRIHGSALQNFSVPD